MPFVIWHGAVTVVVAVEDGPSFVCGPVMFEQAEMANVASARAMAAMWRRDMGKTSRTGVGNADLVGLALHLLRKLGSRGRV